MTKKFLNAHMSTLYFMIKCGYSIVEQDGKFEATMTTSLKKDINEDICERSCNYLPRKHPQFKC